MDALFFFFPVSMEIHITLLYLFPSENEKNIVERNVSTSGVSIYFEAYLYDAPSYTNTQWQLPPTHLSSSQRRPSTATEDEDEDSPSDSQTPEKVKKPKKVYCYVSPKVEIKKLPVLNTCLNDTAAEELSCALYFSSRFMCLRFGLQRFA